MRRSSIAAKSRRCRTRRSGAQPLACFTGIVVIGQFRMDSYPSGRGGSAAYFEILFKCWSLDKKLQEIGRLCGSSWRAAGHFVVEWGLRTTSFLTSWRFSAPMRCASRSTHPEQYSAEAPMDLTWSDQAIRSGMLPGQTHLAHQCAGEPQLPAGASHQPGPTVGCVRVAGADGGPAERLLEKAEGVLDGETPQIPTPQHAQVSRQRTADPGQPQGPRWQLLVGQALDLHADHAERRIRCTSHMQIDPGVNLHAAVGR